MLPLICYDTVNFSKKEVCMENRDLEGLFEKSVQKKEYHPTYHTTHNKTHLTASQMLKLANYLYQVPEVHFSEERDFVSDQDKDTSEN